MDKYTPTFPTNNTLVRSKILGPLTSPSLFRLLEKLSSIPRGHKRTKMMGYKVTDPDGYLGVKNSRGIRSRRALASRMRVPQGGQRKENPGSPRDLVLEGGVEPPRPNGHMDLNHARLPIPPLERA